MVAAVEERKNHPSNKNSTNRTRSQPSTQAAREARVRKTNSSQGQAGAAGKGGHRSARAGALQAVQARLVGNCGAHSQRARHTLCVPVLPQVASRAGSGARLQENAAGAVGPLATGRGGKGAEGAPTEKKALCRRPPPRKGRRGSTRHSQETQE